MDVSLSRNQVMKMINKKLLSLRKAIKTGKPNFERQAANNYPQFKGKWRRPRGIHNKMKNCIKGNKCMPAIGYGSPKSVIGLTPKGMVPVLVSNVNDFEGISDECVAVISASVGMRKRIFLLNFALDKKIHVAGVKSIEEEVNSIRGVFEERKKSRLAKEKKIDDKKKKMDKTEDTKDDKKDAKNLGIKDGRVQEVKGENESKK